MDNPAIVDELSKLYEQKKSGQITEKELNQKRAEVLASLQPTTPPPPPFYKRRGVIVTFIVLLLAAGLTVGLIYGLRNNGKSTNARSGNNGGGSGSSKNANTVAAKLSSGSAAYDATYRAAGGQGAPTGTIEFAAAPPNKFAMIATTSGRSARFFNNGKVTYLCSGTNCFSVSASSAGSIGTLSQFFSGKYWGQRVQTYAHAAAAHRGVTVTDSTMNVAGSRAQCVTFRGGPAGRGGTVCVSSSGILAYAKDLRTGETVTLVKSSGSPSPSLFVLPRGAHVTSGLPSGAGIP